jgi:hypothetical protein
MAADPCSAATQLDGDRVGNAPLGTDFLDRPGFVINPINPAQRFGQPSWLEHATDSPIDNAFGPTGNRGTDFLDRPGSVINPINPAQRFGQPSWLEHATDSSINNAFGPAGNRDCTRHRQLYLISGYHGWV